MTVFWRVPGLIWVVSARTFVGQNTSLIRRKVRITNIQYVNSKVFNHWLDFCQIWPEKTPQSKKKTNQSMVKEESVEIDRNKRRNQIKSTEHRVKHNYKWCILLIFISFIKLMKSICHQQLSITPSVSQQFFPFASVWLPSISGDGPRLDH